MEKLQQGLRIIVPLREQIRKKILIMLSCFCTVCFMISNNINVLFLFFILNGFYILNLTLTLNQGSFNNQQIQITIFTNVRIKLLYSTPFWQVYV